MEDPGMWAIWRPPGEWTRVQVVDAHTAGEPLRVILAGFPELQGGSILAWRRDARARCDGLRRTLMWEPRGHADMYGCLLVPPVTREADFGVLFMHNEGFSTMCGHGIIGVATVALEVGLLPMEEGDNAVGIDTPAGYVEATAHVSEGRVRGVSFVNVPSFVAAADRTVQVPGLGELRYDLAFGGAFYAYVDAADVGLALVPEEYGRIIELGRAVKSAVAASTPIEHPDDPELGFLYGTVFVGPAHGDAHSRNVCVFADGEVDRSPTGTGVSGRLAIHHARGELSIGAEIVVESLVGSTFTGRMLRETRVASYAAVIPQVGGRAFITGRGELLVDPEDPFREGFLLR